MSTRIFFGLIVLFASHGLFAAAENDARKVQLRGLSDRLKYQQGQIHLRD